jgi:phospholipase C
VLENKDFGQLIDAASAPYLNSLAHEYALATNYLAVSHPSQPNYLALFSGSTQGVTDDGRHDIDAPNLADQLTAAGKTWRVYAENVPSGCFTKSSAKSGEDGPGTYTRKHNPAISFRSISGDPRACANITDFSGFDAAAANFSLIVPNACHDMHDCSVAKGDAWLHDFLPRILDSAAYRQDGTIFITADETDSSKGPNRVPLIVISERGPHGATSAAAYTHYSLLRTIQQMLGVPCLANSCQAAPLTDLVSG